MSRIFGYWSKTGIAASRANPLRFFYNGGGTKMKQNEKSSLKKNSNSSNKREDERRKKESQGYTYISIVGWICRRERTRRKDEESMF